MPRPDLRSKSGGARGSGGQPRVGWNAVNAWFGRSKSRRLLRRRVLHFTPSWFTVNMGTGIVNILLHQLPYQFRCLGIISVVFFVLNVILFVIFLLASILRYTLWPSSFWKMLRHPSESLYLGAITMGFATIVNMMVYVCVQAWGGRWVQIAWAFWWIDAVLASFIGIGIPFIMFRYQSHEISKMDGSWLFPVLAPIVLSGTGGIVASVLPPAHARLTIIVSYIIWGYGFPLAFMMLVLDFFRLVMHNLPVPGSIVSIFIAVGPCGMGGFTILQLSYVVRQLAMQTGDGLGTDGMYSAADGMMMANAIYAGTIVVALAIWGMGFFWIIVAICSVTTVAIEKGISFSMGWWALTFPLGVFAVLTNQLGKELNSTAFKVLATILSVWVLILWIYVSIGTAHSALTGFSFPAPSVDEDDELSVFNKINGESQGAGGKEEAKAQV